MTDVSISLIPSAVLAELSHLAEAIDRLTTVAAQLADRVSFIEEYLEVGHPPAPWMVDVPGPDTYDPRSENK